jgi:hypothetical protein
MAAPQASGLRKGDRVELLAVPEDSDYENAGLNVGDRGAVELVDSLRTVHIRWDTGRHLGIIERHRELLRLIGG